MTTDQWDAAALLAVYSAMAIYTLAFIAFAVDIARRSAAKTVVAKALVGAGGDLAARGADVGESLRAMTTYDVRWACDVLRGVHDATDGVDGRVSIEVDARLARQDPGALLLDAVLDLHDTGTDAAAALRHTLRELAVEVGAAIPPGDVPGPATQ